ncbi:MAG: ABC transporter ATP-binding protein [Candidatus Saccharibacteria bacterium]|nr:ABC transporter ATP-binding protein [Pseudorhodobacter sp.]
MITLENLTKAYWYRGKPKYIARNLNAVIPDGARVALMGRNGAGKSTMLSMIAGSINPNCGRIRITGSLSWPIGLTGCIQGDLTGAQNVKFLARVYGVDSDELVAFVEEFAELGMNFNEPVRYYSSGMKGRLNFGMSMGIRFDTYLIDEISATGDASFKGKSRKVFEDRLMNAGLVMVSHSDGLMRAMCTSGAVLEHGAITFYDDIEEAIEVHNRNLRGDGLRNTADELLE